MAYNKDTVVAVKFLKLFGGRVTVLGYPANGVTRRLMLDGSWTPGLTASFPNQQAAEQALEESHMQNNSLRNVIDLLNDKDATIARLQERIAGAERQLRQAKQNAAFHERRADNAIKALQSSEQNVEYHKRRADLGLENLEAVQGALNTERANHANTTTLKEDAANTIRSVARLFGVEWNSDFVVEMGKMRDRLVHAEHQAAAQDHFTPLHTRATEALRDSFDFHALEVVRPLEKELGICPSHRISDFARRVSDVVSSLKQNISGLRQSIDILQKEAIQLYRENQNLKAQTGGWDALQEIGKLVGATPGEHVTDAVRVAMQQKAGLKEHNEQLLRARNETREHNKKLLHTIDVIRNLTNAGNMREIETVVAEVVLTRDNLQQQLDDLRQIIVGAFGWTSGSDLSAFLRKKSEQHADRQNAVMTLQSMIATIRQNLGISPGEDVLKSVRDFKERADFVTEELRLTKEVLGEVGEILGCGPGTRIAAQAKRVMDFARTVKDPEQRLNIIHATSDTNNAIEIKPNG